MSRLAAFVAGLLAAAVLVVAILAVLGCTTDAPPMTGDPQVVELLDSGLIPVRSDRTIVTIGPFAVVIDHIVASGTGAAWYRVRVFLVPGQRSEPRIRQA